MRLATGRRVFFQFSISQFLLIVTAISCVIVLSSSSAKLKRIRLEKERVQKASIYLCDMSVDATTMITLDTNGSVRSWDARTGSLLHTLEDEELCYGIDLSADATHLAVATVYGRIKVLDPKTGVTLTTVATGGQVEGMQLSRRGRYLVTQAAHIVDLWDGHTGERLAQFVVSGTETYGVTVEESPLTVALVDAKGKLSFVRACGDKFIWVHGGENRLRMIKADDSSQQFVVNPIPLANPRYYYYPCTLYKLMDACVNSRLAISPDGCTIVSVTNGDFLKAIDRESGTELWSQDLDDYERELRSLNRYDDSGISPQFGRVIFSKDGKTVVTNTILGHRGSQAWHASSGSYLAQQSYDVNSTMAHSLMGSQACNANIITELHCLPRSDYPPKYFLKEYDLSNPAQHTVSIPLTAEMGEATIRTATYVKTIVCLILLGSCVILFLHSLRSTRSRLSEPTLPVAGPAGRLRHNG